jgi:hypothetical protein
MVENNNFDKYEFYSFSIYLYGYGLFYLFIFEQKLLQAIFLNFFINFILNYTINHNILLFIIHKYWKLNLNNIAMPQLISCTSQLLTYKYNSYMMIPINTITFLLINKIYKKEISYSKNLRIIILGLFILSKLLLS